MYFFFCKIFFQPFNLRFVVSELYPSEVVGLTILSGKVPVYSPDDPSFILVQLVLGDAHVQIYSPDDKLQARTNRFYFIGPLSTGSIM